MNHKVRLRSSYTDINLAFFYTKQDRDANTSYTYMLASFVGQRSRIEN